jgi:two-component system response regulator YesN
VYKVVIVDDENIIVEGLCKVVDWAKFECVVVGSANDASSGAACIRENNPDILFTDIRMPGLDGLTMLAGLKSEFPHMQITVLTGFREFDYAKRAIQLGASRYLLKPSKMSEIEEALTVMTEKLRQEAPIETQKSEVNSFVVNEALKYIDQHYQEKLTLSDVADQIYVSHWYLSKLLNKCTGKTFYDLLNQARIKKAKELMRDPSLKLGKISELVGFMDVSHFSKIFKKLENLPPKEYRNTIQ